MGSLTTAMLSVSRAKRAQIGLIGSFFIQGFLTVSYIPRIPELIDQVNVSFATWGLILGLSGIGGLLPLLFASKVVGRFGTRPVMQVSFLAVSTAIGSFGFVANGWTFFALSFAQTFTMAMYNIALNSHSVVFQNRIGKIILGRFHAAWSIGAASSSLISGALANFIPLKWHLLGVAIIAAGFVLVSSSMMLAPHEDGHDAEVKRAKPVSILKTPNYVVMLSLGLFCGVLPELTMMDWSAVFAKQALHLSPGAVGIPYTIFVTSMIVARLSIGRFTRNRHFSQFAGRLAFVGSVSMALAVLIGPLVAGVDPMLAIAATAIFWIITGLATGPQVPSFFSASGNVPGMSTAQAMSRMSLFNALIILGIKVIMGATAQGISVQAVYGFPILSFVAAGLIARYVVRKNYKPQNPDNVDSYPMTSPNSVIAE